MAARPVILSPDPGAPFPPAAAALHMPEGLLAIGGDLTPVRLLNAYRHGIFPWSSAGQPLLWWSPDPRMVFRTDGVHLSRRFLRDLARSDWTVRADHCFDAVVAACADAARPGQDGTWITPAMQAAYGTLHARNALANPWSGIQWRLRTSAGRKPRASLCSPCAPGSKRDRPSRRQYSMPW